MSLNRWIPRACMAALPLLLLTQCTTNETSPVTPNAVVGTGTPIFPAGTDVVRTFKLQYPVDGPICRGLCTQLIWAVENPCGDFAVTVEGWYDGVFYDLGKFTNSYAAHWDSPGGLHSPTDVKESVVLRFSAYDAAGLIGEQKISLTPRGPSARPIPRPAPEFD